MKGFIQRNKMFVLIMSLLSIIILSLVFYMAFSDYKTTMNTPIEDTDEEVVLSSDGVVITDFSGRYSRNDDSISFSWNYKTNKASVESIQLYYGNQFLVDVTSYRTWTLPREGFGISTGANTFKLVITQEDGKVVEKTCIVNIKKVVKLQQSVEQNGTKTIVTLQYQYDQASPVDIPRIILDNSTYVSDIKYLETTKKEIGSMVEARTSYQFTWNPIGHAGEQIFVRWSFEDINDSFDDTLQIPQQPTDTDKQEDAN